MGNKGILENVYIHTYIYIVLERKEEKRKECKDKKSSKEQKRNVKKKLQLIDYFPIPTNLIQYDPLYGRDRDPKRSEVTMLIQ